MSLSNQLDRLHATLSDIQATVQSITSAPKPKPDYVGAVLRTPLGDLMRDIDASELGLFSLTGDVKDSSGPQVTRAEFVAATPLRKPPSKAQDRHDTRGDDLDPERYAKAALKYLDRYESIRSMPRARSQVESVLQRLEVKRTEITLLQQKLHDLTVAPSDSPSLPEKLYKDQAEDEEKRIIQLEQEIAKAKKPRRKTPIAPSTPVSSAPSKETWDTPKLPVMSSTHRTMHFNDADAGLLMDEVMDDPPLVDVSMVTPLHKRTIFGDPENDDDEEEDKTQILIKPTVETIAPEEVTTPTPASPVSVASTPVRVTSPKITSPSPRSIRITSETERIVGKIWTNGTELITPGQSHSLKAKETIALLRSIASNPVTQETIGSPTPSSLSSQPAGQEKGPPATPQILAAHLLLLLLSAPSHLVPLNTVKSFLTEKDSSGSGTRVLYACVAKKLIKIDRGGREQTVKFDF